MEASKQLLPPAIFYFYAEDDSDNWKQFTEQCLFNLPRWLECEVVFVPIRQKLFPATLYNQMTEHYKAKYNKIYNWISPLVVLEITDSNKHYMTQLEQAISFCKRDMNTNFIYSIVVIDKTSESALSDFTKNMLLIVNEHQNWFHFWRNDDLSAKFSELLKIFYKPPCKPNV